VGIEFIDDVPVPTENARAYSEIYVLEQWLRRLAVAALAARVGENVLGAVPDELARQLKQRRATLPRRLHLAVESADELLWLTTLEEMRDLLTSESLFPTVRRLTGFERETLSMKMNEIREIRNVIGHNRAVTAKTLTILEGNTVSLEHGLEKFRGLVMADRSETLNRLEGKALASIGTYFDSRVEAWPDDQQSAVGLAQTDDFVFAGVVPRYRRQRNEAEPESFGEWLDLQWVVGELASVSESVLAVVIPQRGTSFSLVWSTKVASATHEALIDVFVTIAASGWCDDEYATQDERFVCHPKIWFGEVTERQGRSRAVRSVS
jgi:hypothetical protein